jgi:TRAP-type C4-dicarboxylate transport system permease small subunit
MLNQLKKIKFYSVFLVAVVCFSVLSFPYVSLAIPGPDDSATNRVEIKNPIASNTLQEFVADILNIVVTVSMPFLVVMIIYAGFTYVNAQGNPAKIQAAHQMILWTLVGAGIILGAFIIARAIEGTINALKRDTGTAYIMELDRG